MISQRKFKIRFPTKKSTRLSSTTKGAERERKKGTHLFANSAKKNLFPATPRDSGGGIYRKQRPFSRHQQDFRYSFVTARMQRRTRTSEKVEFNLGYKFCPARARERALFLSMHSGAARDRCAIAGRIKKGEGRRRRR